MNLKISAVRIATVISGRDRSSNFRILQLLVVFLVASTGGHVLAQDNRITTQETELQESESKDVHNLRPKLPTAELLEKSEQAIQDGLNYLVKTQNEDGSWGSHDPQVAKLANFGFALRNRGSQDAVRTACTAICAEAFLNQANRTAEQQKALEKAIDDLIKVKTFAFHPGESFNTWGYGYKLGFLTLLRDAPEGKELTDQIDKAAQSCVDALLKFQQHNGGWHYYSRQMNDAGSMSFNTSFFALTLHRAKAHGLDVPEGMVGDAAKVVERQRVPDGSFHYDSRFFNSGRSALMNLGSGSRTISNTYALYKLGHYSQRDLLAGMKVFDNGENYLEMGRKRIVPHSVVHQISGYFFFFGYNYASATAEILGDVVPQSRWDRFSWTMLRTQEDDGQWWDTAAAGYGDKWGTGFAIQTLQRYVKETKRRIAEKTGTEESENNADDED